MASRKQSRAPRCSNGNRQIRFTNTWKSATKSTKQLHQGQNRANRKTFHRSVFFSLELRSTRSDASTNGWVLFQIIIKMSSVAFIFDIIFSCLVTLIFLYRCGNYRRQHPVTTIAVFVAWFFSVLIVFTLPLDISLVSHSRLPHARSMLVGF